MTANFKEIVFEEEARDFLRQGIDQLADVVSITLGPRGRNVGLQSSWGSPTITSDGNTISKDVELKDAFLNMGIALGKEVAEKIKEKAGDGTTTGIVLFRSLVANGIKHVTALASPVMIKRGMDHALEKVLAEIDNIAFHIATETETKNIATVSASGNQEIGEVITSAFQKVGKTGVITIEEGKSTETNLALVEGMQFDKGYASPYFVTNSEKMTAELHLPAILITDKKITSPQEILTILQHVASSGRELLIIADDFEGDALSTLVVNKLRGILKVVAVKAPGFGDRRKALLEDLAILTGAEVVSEEKGLYLRDADISVLGSADQVVIKKEETTIVGGKGDTKALEERIAIIAAEIQRTSSSYDREKLEERKAKLAGGVAVIQVGAPTESEMKKKKQMYEDSLSATKAALEEGIAPGGGVVLLRAAQKLRGQQFSKEDQIGAEILIKALEAPFRQIVSNAGFDPSVMLNEVLEKDGSFGFNAETERVEDLVKAGILDPVKVIKSSLIHAVSVAGIVLLSEALIAPGKE